MKISMPAVDLLNYLKSLLGRHFPDGRSIDISSSDFSLALERCEYSFSKIKIKYYEEIGGGVLFDHLNADHMAAFLYFLGNTIWKNVGDIDLPVKLSYLNKILHGVDLFYSVRMPDVFLLVHPLGSVIGNAKYSDYLVVYQNVTIGAVGTEYPSFGEGVILYSRSGVIGGCQVGDNVVFAANSFIINTDVPSGTVVLGSYPHLVYKENLVPVHTRLFNPSLRE